MNSAELGNGICAQFIYPYLHNQCQILCAASTFLEINLTEKQLRWNYGGVVLVMYAVITGKHETSCLYYILYTVDDVLFSPPL